MKLVIFAGGVGSRLWPLSRKNTPKQFEKIIGDKSTLQQTVERLSPQFSFSDIYVATGKRYEETVREQLSQIPPQNFIFEPEMRDVGPAIGLVAYLLNKKFPDEPIAILWSDHLVKHIETFKKSLKLAEEAVEKEHSPFVFIAQKARFANQNMGWIELGVKKDERDGIEMYNFKRLVYRPKLGEAQTFLKDKNFVWNLGYFVSTPAFLVSMYKAYAPSMQQGLEKISDAFETDRFEETLAQEYMLLRKVSFDDLILVKLRPDNVLVLSADLGWSDVGAWESLKEALSTNEEETVTKGKVMVEDCKDSLVFNYTDQLLVGIDLDDMLIINTGDVILVCPKKSVPKIKKLVESLSGTAHEHLA
ncbi:MAG TPA: sugar phosphate nucleotidyltransferase [Candidatus Saccharimonadales bacterium]|nr:sugar phosphate nucleotidyltransferase [Candidatus Saccharimonadales bacterium]